MMKVAMITAAVLVGALIAPGTVSATTSSTIDSSATSRAAFVQHRIEDRLHVEAALAPYGIHADVDRNGVVTLRGTVPTRQLVGRAIELARISGIARIDNRLAINPRVAPMETQAAREREHAVSTSGSEVPAATGR